MFKLVTYRFIKDFGWYVVDIRAAKAIGVTRYSNWRGRCKRGHIAPFSVLRRKCVVCLAIIARNKGKGRTNEESFRYWTLRLKLSNVKDTENVRYIYVVENMPYPRMSDAVKMTKLTESIIYARCQQEAWPAYQMIPTKFKLRQLHVYYCDGREYNSLPNAAKGEKISTQSVMFNIHNPKLTKWYRQKVM